MSCSGGTNKVGMIAAARAGKLDDGASFSHSFTQIKTMGIPSPFSSPPHSLIHSYLYSLLPSFPFQNRRQNENGEMKRTTSQLSDWKPSPLFLNSYPPRGVRARSTTNHVEGERERQREWEGGRTAIFAPFKDVWHALFPQRGG